MSGQERMPVLTPQPPHYRDLHGRDAEAVNDELRSIRAWFSCWPRLSIDSRDRLGARVVSEQGAKIVSLSGCERPHRHEGHHEGVPEVPEKRRAVVFWIPGRGDGVENFSKNQ